MEITKALTKFRQELEEINSNIRHEQQKLDQLVDRLCNFENDTEEFEINNEKLEVECGRLEAERDVLEAKVERLSEREPGRGDL